MFARMIKTQTPGLRAIVQRSCSDSRGWAQQVLRDISVMQLASTKLENVQPPHHDVQTWENIASKFQNSWKGLLKDALPAMSVFLSRGNPQQEEKQEDTHPPPQPQWMCAVCPATFKSKTAKAVHERHKHAILAPERYYARGSSCLSCQHDYHSRARLVIHLRMVPKCMSAMPLIAEPLTTDEVLALDAADRPLARANRKAGLQTFFAHLPPFPLEAE